MNKLILSISLAFITTASHAADVWLLQAAADGWSDGCRTQSWSGDAVFQNTTDAPATIRLLGVSNSAITDPAVPTSFDIPPHRTVTLLQKTRGLWRASTVPAVWVTHLDVPAGVLVEGRIDVGVNDYCSLFPIARTPSLGKVSQPAIRSLTPAGQAQVHVGTDLGLVESRTNVALYNAGDVAATASVELRRACDDALLASQIVAVDANTFVQIGLGSTAPDVSGCSDAPSYVRYTVVRLTQPGLSWVSAVAGQVRPTDPPIISVPMNVNLTQ